MADSVARDFEVDVASSDYPNGRSIASTPRPAMIADVRSERKAPLEERAQRMENAAARYREVAFSQYGDKLARCSSRACTNPTRWTK
jgi:hypothetical protein